MLTLLSKDSVKNSDHFDVLCVLIACTVLEIINQMSKNQKSSLIVWNTVHLLKTSCSLVLKDEGFQLPTPLAEKALKSAERLLEWLSDAENKEAVSIFASNFIGSLNSCFSTYRTARSGREQMWERY